MKQEFTNFNFENYQPIYYKEKKLTILLQWIQSTKELEGVFKKIVVEEEENEILFKYSYIELYSHIELYTERGYYSISIDDDSLGCIYWGNSKEKPCSKDLANGVFSIDLYKLIVKQMLWLEKRMNRIPEMDPFLVS